MKSNHLVGIVQCQILRPRPSKSCSKYTDCFNDLAFIRLFSHLRVNADRFNLEKPNPLPSSQVGLATPPDMPINLPEIISGFTVAGEGNTIPVLHDSTKHGSCDSTPQALAPIPGVPAHPLVPVAAENKTTTPTSGASCSQKKILCSYTWKTYRHVQQLVSNCLFIGSFNLLFFISFLKYRSIVQPLVIRVPGNCHCSFDSYEEVLEVYEEAKTWSDLCVIWITVEDEKIYGPEEKDAMM